MSATGIVLLALIVLAAVKGEPHAGTNKGLAGAVVFVAVMLAVVYVVYDVGSWAPPFGS